MARVVVEADKPNDVHVHLVGALLRVGAAHARAPSPTEPEAGADADLHQVLEELWWRLDARALDTRWMD